MRFHHTDYGVVEHENFFGEIIFFIVYCIKLFLEITWGHENSIKTSFAWLRGVFLSKTFNEFHANHEIALKRLNKTECDEKSSHNPIEEERKKWNSRLKNMWLLWGFFRFSFSIQFVRRPIRRIGSFIFLWRYDTCFQVCITMSRVDVSLTKAFENVFRLKWWPVSCRRNWIWLREDQPFSFLNFVRKSISNLFVAKSESCGPYRVPLPESTEKIFLNDLGFHCFCWHSMPGFSTFFSSHPLHCHETWETERKRRLVAHSANTNSEKAKETRKREKVIYTNGPVQGTPAHIAYAPAGLCWYCNLKFFFVVYTFRSIIAIRIELHRSIPAVEETDCRSNNKKAQDRAAPLLLAQESESWKNLFIFCFAFFVDFSIPATEWMANNYSFTADDLENDSIFIPLRVFMRRHWVGDEICCFFWPRNVRRHSNTWDFLTNNTHYTCREQIQFD